MNRVATNLWCDNWTYATVGTSGDANTRESAGLGITATQSGLTVTASSNFFDDTSPGDVGNMIKFSGGSEVMITSVTSQSIVSVSTSQTITPGQTFTVYRTNQRNLAAESRRTNNYFTGTPFCGYTLVDDVLTNTRTWDFPVETTLVTYREIGMSWAASQTVGDHFARIVLPSPIVINLGQRLRMTYELQLTLSPVIAYHEATQKVVGWPTGTYNEQLQLLMMSVVNSANGATTNSHTYAINEPSVTTNLAWFMSYNSTALTTFNGTPVSRYVSASDSYSTTSVGSSYTTNAFVLERSIALTIGQGNLTAGIRAIGFGSNYGGGNSEFLNVGYAQLFDSTQVKTNAQTLAMSYRWAWSRALA